MRSENGLASSEGRNTDSLERSAGHVDKRLEMDVARLLSSQCWEAWGIVLPQEILEGYMLRRRLSLGSLSSRVIISNCS